MKKASWKQWAKRLAPGIGAIAALFLGYLGGLAHQPPPRTIEVVKIVKVPVEIVKTVPVVAPKAAPVERAKRKRAAKPKAAGAPKKFLGIF